MKKDKIDLSPSFVKVAQLREAKAMYEQADLGYLVTSTEGWERASVRGFDALTQTVYTVPRDKVNGPSTARELMVTFIKSTAAVAAVTLDHEHVSFKPFDISKLETNTQKIERLEREVGELRAFGKKYGKHLPNCHSTSKSCYCELSQEMKRLGIGGKVGGKACHTEAR